MAFNNHYAYQTNEYDNVRAASENLKAGQNSLSVTKRKRQMNVIDLENMHFRNRLN